ncbi:MAG TPA: hypothetical protein PK141_17525, partial [Polyangiaceae bacterium]|nr:hypothetical protein [Polyangiaceae bacterium]
MRLILRGDSVIDWHRLNFVAGEADEFLASQEFQAANPADRARMRNLRAEAIGYLRRHLDYPIPKPVENASVEELRQENQRLRKELRRAELEREILKELRRICEGVAAKCVWVRQLRDSFPVT